MAAASLPMLINIFVSGMFVASFLTIAQLNPGFTHIRWIAASFAVGLLTPLADLLMPLAGASAPFVLTSFGGLFVAMVMMGPAISGLYGHRPAWGMAIGTLVIGGAMCGPILWTRHDSLWYHFAYQIPFSLAALVSAITIRKHGRGTGLDRAATILFAAVSAHFLLKPLLRYNLGATDADYANSSYALISHVSSGALLVAAGLLILINALQLVVLRDRADATCDALTELPNRRALQDAFGRMPKASGGIIGAIAILDLDHFKRINDDWGHDRGDDVLRAVARCLESNKPVESSVFRLGGEEFVLLMESHNQHYVQLACENLRLAVRQLSFDDIGSISVSIGATPIARHEELSEALSRADRNLYSAKRDGRDRSRFEPLVAETSATASSLRLIHDTTVADACPVVTSDRSANSQQPERRPTTLASAG